MQYFSSLYCKILKLQSNFWRTHVKNFSDNLLAVKFLTLFGTGTLPDAVQRRDAGRRSRNRISHGSYILF
jgi:hypothetical protein